MPCTGGGCKQRRRNKNPTPPLPYKAKPVLCSAFFSKPQNTQNTWALPGRGSAQQGHAAQSAPPSRSRAGQRPHRGTCRAKIKKYQALYNTKTMIFRQNNDNHREVNVSKMGPRRVLSGVRDLKNCSCLLFVHLPPSLPHSITIYPLAIVGVSPLLTNHVIKRAAGQLPPDRML